MEDKYIIWEDEKWYYDIEYYRRDGYYTYFYKKIPKKNILDKLLNIEKNYKFRVDFNIEDLSLNKTTLKDKLNVYFKKYFDELKRKEEIENNELI